MGRWTGQGIADASAKVDRFEGYETLVDGLVGMLCIEGFLRSETGACLAPGIADA